MPEGRPTDEAGGFDEIGGVGTGVVDRAGVGAGGIGDAAGKGTETGTGTLTVSLIGEGEGAWGIGIEDGIGTGAATGWTGGFEKTGGIEEAPLADIRSFSLFMSSGVAARSFEAGIGSLFTSFILFFRVSKDIGSGIGGLGIGAGAGTGVCGTTLLRTSFSAKFSPAILPVGMACLPGMDGRAGFCSLLGADVKAFLMEERTPDAGFDCGRGNGAFCRGVCWGA